MSNCSEACRDIPPGATRGMQGGLLTLSLLQTGFRVCRSAKGSVHTGIVCVCTRGWVQCFHLRSTQDSRTIPWLCECRYSDSFIKLEQICVKLSTGRSVESGCVASMCKYRITSVMQVDKHVEGEDYGILLKD